MDSRNKITQDMLQPKVERSFSDEEGSSDYLLEFSDNDSDSSDVRYNRGSLCVRYMFTPRGKGSLVCPFRPQSAHYDVQTVSWLQGGCQPAAVCYRPQLLASWSASFSSRASSPQTSGDRGVC